MSWKRARNDEQKEERVREVIEASLRLYAGMKYDKITYGLIAKEAGWARSNLYKYFSTKEEIFLEILIRDIQEWYASVITDLRNAHNGQLAQADAFALFWFESFNSRPRLTSILGMLNTTIEKNVSLEKLRRAKRTFREAYEELGAVLTEKGLFTEPAAAAEFITVQMALTTGFFPLRDLTDHQRQAMEAEGWELDLDSYGLMYIRALTAVVEKLRI